MLELSVAVTLIVSLGCIYYILTPYFEANIKEQVVENGLDYKKEVALVLLEELKDLNDSKDAGNISDEDFQVQKQLLLEDAKNVV